MTTREQRRQCINNHRDEITQEYGSLAVLVCANFFFTLVALIAWGFGAPNMHWATLVLAALTAYLLYTFKKRVREYADQRIKEGDQ